MVPINGEAWMKSVSFDISSGMIKGKMNVHNISDLISVISREIPIDVNTIFIASLRRLKSL